MTDFKFQEMFPLEEDTTEYRLLSTEHVSVTNYEDGEIVNIAPEALSLLSEEAFKDVSHLMRTAHLKKVSAIIDDPEASENDRFVALELLRNAVIAADGEFPMCQDTGTAIIMGKKGHRVMTDGSDEAALSYGVFKAYQKNNLRYSQNAPLSMYEEQNTLCNLPAQIELYATKGGRICQQNLLVSGDQSAPEPGIIDGIHEGQNEDARYGGLSPLSSGICRGGYIR